MPPKPASVFTGAVDRRPPSRTPLLFLTHHLGWRTRIGFTDPGQTRSVEIRISKFQTNSKSEFCRYNYNGFLIYNGSITTRLSSSHAFQSVIVSKYTNYPCWTRKNSSYPMTLLKAHVQGARPNDHPPSGSLGFSASGRKDQRTSVLAALCLQKQTIPWSEAFMQVAAAAAG
jgi:hypothetical protein